MNPDTLAEGYSGDALNAIADVDFKNVVASVGLQWPMPKGIIVGCVESKSPVILQVSGSARNYADPTFLPFMVMGAVQMAKELGAGIPIALHLDHGDSFELAKSCIDSGFSSVMLDGSHHPFDENADKFVPTPFGDSENSVMAL